MHGPCLIWCPCSPHAILSHLPRLFNLGRIPGIGRKSWGAQIPVFYTGLKTSLEFLAPTISPTVPGILPRLNNLGRCLKLLLAIRYYARCPSSGRVALNVGKNRNYVERVWQLRHHFFPTHLWAPHRPATPRRRPATAAGRRHHHYHAAINTRPDATQELSTRPVWCCQRYVFSFLSCFVSVRRGMWSVVCGLHAA